MTVYNFDCIMGMRLVLADNSVDAIVTDPPYELTNARPGGRSAATEGKVMKGFMGMEWDGSGIAYSVEMWREALRVLKPGGHLLSFGGSRTYHRMACAIEDAGFEIRDQIMWIYGTGFPKSHNGEWGGTALKPAHEPICVARKPLIGTVADNWATHGTGALNIDGCRINPGQAVGGDGQNLTQWRQAEGRTDVPQNVRSEGHDAGRWPANLIHDGTVEFPGASGAKAAVTGNEPSASTANTFGQYDRRQSSEPRREVDTSAARFFYCAKATKADRDEGLADFEVKAAAAMAGNLVGGQRLGGDGSPIATPMRANTHPTVKPTDLMRYLLRLVTPPGGLVLDQFSGSGSTGKAAKLEGFQFVGFEMSPEYTAIANARIAGAK